MSHAIPPPALVVLAAGLGSRYGDAKQVAAVGPGGEWLLEYAIHDALAAGFGQVVVVIRAELRPPLAKRLEPLLRGRARLDWVEQRVDRVPAGCFPIPGRAKPLGTGHALWCCTSNLHGPFAVVNADDYYGATAFRLLTAHFRTSREPAMVGYRLGATLSASGSVNRGVCEVAAGGTLVHVTEFTGIERGDGAITGVAPDGQRQTLGLDATVSLNCWGLWPNLLPDLDAGLRAYLAHADTQSEYFLPHAIDHHLARSGQRLAVLPSADAWMGLTHPGDRPQVMRELAALHAAGAYPTPLWSPS